MSKSGAEARNPGDGWEFRKIPVSIMLDKALPDSAFRLLSLLTIHADYTTGETHVSNATLAKGLDKSVRAVGNALAELKKRGYVATTETRVVRGGKPNTDRRIRLLWWKGPLPSTIGTRAFVDRPGRPKLRLFTEPKSEMKAESTETPTGTGIVPAPDDIESIMRGLGPHSSEEEIQRVITFLVQEIGTEIHTTTQGIRRAVRWATDGELRQGLLAEALTKARRHPSKAPVAVFLKCIRSHRERRLGGRDYAEADTDMQYDDMQEIANNLDNTF